jgi:hypothetical protein
VSESEKPEKVERVVKELRAIQESAAELQKRLGAVIKDLGAEDLQDAEARAELARVTVEKLRLLSRTKARTAGRTARKSETESG